MSVYTKPSDPAKRHSAALTDGVDRAPARAMLKAVGFTDEDLAKPLVGVATTWIETMPCNFNQRVLAKHVKDGIRAAGGTPIEFNTVAVSDGVSMGTTGMRASLISREVIADSIELVCAGHLLDGLVSLVGCDKTIPAGVMALARLDIPGLVFYNGSIAPGRYDGRDVTIQDVFEAVGARAAGRMTDEEVHALESAACPGAGACGGQFTANTMALVIDFLGISPRGLSGIPATHATKADAARSAGELVDEAGQRGHSSVADPDARRLRERDRRGRRLGRIDQRRSPPDRNRTRGRHQARARGLRLDCRTHPDRRRPEAGRPLRGDGHVRGGRRCPRRARARRSGRCARRRARRRRPDARRGRRRRPRDTGPGRRRPVADPAQADRRPRDPARLARARRLGRQARGSRAPVPQRPRAGVRVRGRLLRGSEGAFDQAGRRGGHPLRGPGRRPRHARDAARHRRARRRGPRRRGRADHRRPLLRRDPRPDGRPHLARGGSRRHDRRGPRRRHDRARRREAHPRPRRPRRGDRKTARGMDAARAPLQPRRVRQVRSRSQLRLPERGRSRDGDANPGAVS